MAAVNQEKLKKVYGTAHGMEEAQQQTIELQTSANVTADWNLQYMGRGQTPPDIEPAKTANPPCYKCGKIDPPQTRVSTGIRDVELVRNTDT